MSPTELFSLDKRNILVTGATGYLGQDMAKAIVAAGGCVYVNGRDAKRVNKLVSELNNLGGSAHAAIFDVLELQAIKDWFNLNSEIVLHGIINNAYTGSSGSIETAVAEDYRSSFEISVVSAQNVLTQAMESLRRGVKELGSSSVVNIASMYGVVSPNIDIYESKKAANPPFYGAAKAALLQWSRYAACEFGKDNIRFNCISPGPFPNCSVQNNQNNFVQKLIQRVPLGRVGSSREIGGPAVFLLSEASSFVNGANIPVDGGWTCW